MSTANRAVFLSYASQDAEAARKICDALRAAGVEVWFDQTELRGGDSWDAKIRKQIKECALFMPIISANTQARPEGYFRLEWKLADRRTDLIGKSKAFLLPVCIDDTAEGHADVPDSFLSVQWTRLAGGEPPAAFCERVRALLDGRDVPARRPNSRAGIQPGQPEETSRPRSRWLAPAIGATAIVALALWHPWKEAGAPADFAAAKHNPAAPLSKARQLAAQADALFDQDEYVLRENLVLAERFCQQAAELDPNDAEVWAIYSRLCSQYVFLTYDRSLERRAQAGDHATRALRLAPQSFEARFAQAHFYRLDEASYREAERLLRELLAEKPNDKRVWRTLGHTLRYPTIFAPKGRGRDAEAADCFQHAAALPGGDRLALHYLGTTLAALGRLDEGEAALNNAIALKPRTATDVNMMNLLIRYRGDVARAREALTNIPIEWLREDYGAYIAALVWWCSREPDKMIELLRALPRDYLEAVYDGPKGVLIGQALRMAGRTQAAQIEWRAALQVVERRLAAQANNVRLIVWKSVLLAFLGESEEAKRLLRAAEELGLSARDSWGAATIPLELGDSEKAISLLAVALKESTVVTRAFLRINPAWDTLRGNPRFEALIAEPPAAKVSLAPKSIAVLAFENRSSEKDSEYFSEGISDELLNELGRVAGLRVIGRTSSFAFKRTNDTAKEIGQKLGVAHLVEGSVQCIGSRAHIIARLIRAETGERIWSDSFDTELKDIFAAQHDIAGRITEYLKLTLGYAPRVTKVINPEAHRLVLEGIHLWSSRRPEDLARAEARFLEALKIDPEFAFAHAKLAMCRGSMASFRSSDGSDVADLIVAARKSAQKALALDVTQPDAHDALGWVVFLEGRLNEADPHFQAALRINPNDAHAHYHRSHLLAELGRLDLALESSQRALEIDPAQPQYVQQRAQFLLFAQRAPEAVAMIERCLELRGDFLQSLSVQARALLACGRMDDAVRVARSIKDNQQSAQRGSVDSTVIHVFSRANMREEAADYARAILPKFRENGPGRRLVLLALGRHDEALENATPARYYSLSGREVYWHELWDPVRNDPRFARVLEGVQRAEYYPIARETLARMIKESGNAK